MIRFILLLVFLAAAALLGPQLANHQGYVLIAVAGYTVEMSAITAVILAVAFYAVLLLTENLLSRVFGLRRGLRFWLRQRHYVKAQKQTQKGMTALAEGQFRRAETLMSRSAEQSELPLLNYLSAAEAAHAQQSFEKRDTYLQQAEEANPQAQLAIRLTQVRLLQEQGNWEASLVQLQTLHGRFQNNPQVLTRLKIAYEAMQDWESLLALIPALKNSRSFQKPPPMHSRRQRISRYFAIKQPTQMLLPRSLFGKNNREQSVMIATMSCYSPIVCWKKAILMLPLNYCCR